MTTRRVQTEEVGIYLTTTVLTTSGTAMDLSDATETLIYLRAPDGTTQSGTYDFTVSGTDGALQYQTQAGDIDQAGIWQYQSRVTWASGVSLVSPIQTFEAEEPIFP